ncbi:MAG TPA: hypothetical protein VN922_18690 [Bacteroidia bacterium]|nr:hypothetical protein [Bacteroidia bacterium]
MLAYTLKHVLELAPKAVPLIKQAHVDEDFPLSNKDSCIASALCMNYHVKVDRQPMDLDKMEKIASAIALYQVEDIVRDLTDTMLKSLHEKKASKLKPESYMLKQAHFEGGMSGFMNPALQSDEAVELYKEASALGMTPSDEVLRYSGHCFLRKEAAVKSLAVRYHETSDVGYVKLASAVGKVNELTLKPETIVDLCKTVSEMDKKAGLEDRGFNFFKEALVVKEAQALEGMTVTVRNREVPMDTIMALGEHRLAEYLGTDITREMQMGPMNFKAALEALPIDSQQLLLRMTKCV